MTKFGTGVTECFYGYYPGRQIHPWLFRNSLVFTDPPSLPSVRSSDRLLSSFRDAAPPLQVPSFGVVWALTALRSGHLHVNGDVSKKGEIGHPHLDLV